MSNGFEQHRDLSITVPEVTCDTPSKLAASETVRNFLTMMNGESDGDGPVTAQSLVRSFRDFERTRAYFERYKVLGSPRDIQRLMALVDELGDQVKRVDTGYKLPREEVTERFAGLGVDIEKKRTEWERFYRKAGYKKGLVVNGVMEEDEAYELPMPEICEAEMRAFEEVLKMNRGMEVMVDDARLTPSETFNFFQRRKNKKNDPVTSVRLVQALPVTPQMVQKYAETKDDQGISVDELDPVSSMRDLHSALLADYENDLHRGVRLVAFDPEAKFAYWGIGNSKKGIVNEAERVKGSIQFMEIGTYMRVCKFLETCGGDMTLYKFQNYEDHREQGYIPLTTMTANIAPDGKVFAVNYVPNSKRFDIRKVDPSGKDLHFGDIVREVVQTKI